MKLFNQLLIIVVLLSLCISIVEAQNSDNGSNQLIVTDNSIISEFTALPDSSVNVKAVYKHFQKYPERWKTAFKFLKEFDKNALSKGRVDLSDNVYYSYNEYTPKSLENANYESHKQYIDIQYLIEGEEYIGYTHNTSIPIKKEYNEKKDIEFYNYDGGVLLKASPDKYFIFFPEDIHKPSIKTENNTLVKKIVVKIKID